MGGALKYRSPSHLGFGLLALPPRPRRRLSSSGMGSGSVARRLDDLFLGVRIRRHPWLSSVWKQPRSPGPMEPGCHKPMSHWSQVVKGTTTGSNWLRVVTPYPLGTQSGPLRFPYAPLMQTSPDQGTIFIVSVDVQ